MPRPRSILSSARLIALCTLISRITGLIRDMLLAHAFGLQWVQDAFNYAFQFPNLFRRLFGEGALSAAFVPTFTRVLERDGRPAAWRLLARMLALLTTTTVALTLLIELLVGLVWWLAPVADPQQAQARGLLLSLTALMLPFMVSLSVLALLASVLNCAGSFVVPALVPVVLNVVMIGGILWLGPLVGGSAPHGQIYGVAASVLIAGVFQLLFVYPALRAHRIPLGWRFEPRDPEVRGMLGLVAPVLLGQGVVLLSTFLDTQICALLTRVRDTPDRFRLLEVELAYPLQEGALSAITVAQRLYQFPLGVLVISLATAALPAFSRMAVRGDWAGWIAQVRRMLRLAVFEGLLAGALLIALAEPIVRLLFEYGRFTSADTARTAAVAVWYGAGLWAFCAQHIVHRAYYSLGDVRTPMWLSLSILPFSLVLTLALVWVDGVGEAAFAISTTVGASLSVVAGLVLLRRRVGVRLVDRETVLSLVKMLAASAATAVLVLALRPFALVWLSGMQVGVLVSRAADTLGWLAIGVVVNLVLARLVGLSEPRMLLSLRGGRRAAGPD